MRGKFYRRSRDIDISKGKSISYNFETTWRDNFFTFLDQTINIHIKLINSVEVSLELWWNVLSCFDNTKISVKIQKIKKDRFCASSRLSYNDVSMAVESLCTLMNETDSNQSSEMSCCYSYDGKKLLIRSLLGAADMYMFLILKI